MHSLDCLSRLALAAIAVTCAGSAASHAQPVSTVVVFGDSASDVGNVLSVFDIPASPPYYLGRFGNGPMWVERLAELLEVSDPRPSALRGTNYAFGGATTGSNAGFGLPDLPNMDVQVQRYLDEQVPNGRELAVLWGGYNDLSFGQTDLDSIVGQLGRQARDLADAGVRRIMIPNLQPAVTADEQQFLTPEVVSKFNSLLSKEITRLRVEPNLQVFPFDVFQVFTSVIADPAGAGFSQVTQPACPQCDELGADAQVSDDPNAHLLWDESGHVSASMNRLLGEAAFDVLPESLKPNTTTLVPIQSEWKYFAGTHEPSAFPNLEWTTPGFDDADWSTGTEGFGYGDADELRFVGTPLEAMRGGHLSLYLRHEFAINDSDSIDAIRFHVDYDDAFIAYVNGIEVARSEFGSITQPVAHDERPKLRSRESSFRETFRIDLAESRGLLHDGDANVVAIQGINRTATDSDFVLAQLSLTAETVAEPSSPGAFVLAIIYVTGSLRRRRRI